MEDMLLYEVEGFSHTHGLVLENNKSLSNSQNTQYRPTKPLHSDYRLISFPPTPWLEEQASRFVLLCCLDLLNVHHCQNIRPAICQFHFGNIFHSFRVINL